MDPRAFSFHSDTWKLNLLFIYFFFIHSNPQNTQILRRTNGGGRRPVTSLAGAQKKRGGAGSNKWLWLFRNAPLQTRCPLNYSESVINPRPRVASDVESHLHWKWTLIPNAQMRRTHCGSQGETRRSLHCSPAGTVVNPPGCLSDFCLQQPACLMKLIHWFIDCLPSSNELENRCFGGHCRDLSLGLVGNPKSHKVAQWGLGLRSSWLETSKWNTKVQTLEVKKSKHQK